MPSGPNDHPYIGLPKEAYWKTAVSEVNPLSIEGLWKPRFPILPPKKLITAGSCFAQHIGKALKRESYNWYDAEPGPAPPSMFADDSVGKKYNYGIFSFRTGNIYTCKMLLQWVKWATGESTPVERYWEKDGRFYDPYRPMIEPNGFDSVESLELARTATLNAIKHAISESVTMVFTMGLTESWCSLETGEEYANCPGVTAGKFNPKKHGFVNHSYKSCVHDALLAIKLIRKASGGRMKVLLTVSPVPLTATASGDHIVLATMRSKSILRAVCQTVTETFPFVDYFPSYEIITSPVYKGYFYKPNMRQVDQNGVDFVMKHFFAGQRNAFGKQVQVKNKQKNEDPPPSVTEVDDVMCEDAMLEAFAR